MAAHTEKTDGKINSMKQTMDAKLDKQEKLIAKLRASESALRKDIAHEKKMSKYSMERANHSDKKANDIVTHIMKQFVAL